jgi:anti-sigma factor ChrR (cupin superfamily)
MDIFQKPLRGRRETGTFNVVASNSLEWKESDEKGFWTKELFADPDASKITMLMKVDPGAFADDHAHDVLEQIYVLQGDFYDQSQTYVAGDYIARQPGAVHRTGSKNGAVVLLVFG